jgi:hypothetical protein
MSPPLCQDRSSLWNTAFGFGTRRTGGFFFIGVRLFKFKLLSAHKEDRFATEVPSDRAIDGTNC